MHLRLTLRAAIVGVLLCASCNSAEQSPPPKLKLELFLMATCPFASDLLTGFLPAVGGLGDVTDLSVNYIGGVSDQGLTSMYGREDVEAATRGVCALELGGPVAWQKQVACELTGGTAACRDRAGISEQRFHACLTDGTGYRLLKESFARTAKAGISESPTLVVNGKPYQGGRTALVLSHRLCEAAPALTPYCRDRAKPAPVKVTLIGDSRCPASTCDDAPFRRFAQMNLVNVEFETLDWQDARARALLADTGVSTLPAAVIDPSIEQDAALYKKLLPHLKPLAHAKGYVFSIGSAWDPT